MIGYIRVSTVDQAESGAGMESQRAAIIAECARNGWELAEIIEDAGQSGKGLNRPGMQKALAMLADGKAAGMICAKLDRLSRSVKDFAELVDVSRYYGWSLIILDCQVDTSTPAGEMLAGVMVQFAQFERRMIAQRTKDALAVKKAQGVQLGRRVTLDEQTEVRIITERKQGKTLQAIADALNSEGVSTAQGGTKWYPATIRQILSRAA